MIQQDRDRLILSLFLAVVVHVGIFVGLSFVNWQIRDYPETSAVFVELMDYESPPAPEPVIPEPEPPQPEPEIQPVEPEPQPQVTERAPDRPATQAPAPAPAQQPATTQSTPPASTDAPPGSFTTEDLPWLSSPDDTTDREASRTSSEDIFRFEETADTGELPAWVAEGTIQPLNTLDAPTRQSLEDKNQEIPGFQDRLNAIINSVARSASQTATSTNGSDTAATTTSGPPGVGPIEWVGGGTRTFLGVPTMPSLTSADFGGLVPARITYIMVFDVNADGLVVPGSLIFRQSSGYTAADQKVRRAVSSWRFEPAPGSPPVTAICTLVLERDDIR